MTDGKRTTPKTEYRVTNNEMPWRGLRESTTLTILVVIIGSVY